MKRDMWIFLAFISIFFAGGFWLLHKAVTETIQSQVAAGWPTTIGSIETCELDTQTDGEGGTVYTAKVRYSYTVGGRTYSNDNLAFGYTGSDEIQAQQEIVDRLANAESVEVRYNDANPESSALSFGFHRSLQLLVTCAAVVMMFLIGITALVLLSSTKESVLLDNIVTRP